MSNQHSFQPEILFQNEYFIAVLKPSGLLSTPPRFEDGRPVLGLQLQKYLGQQIYPVHRLDYEVSGIVLYALTAKAHSAASVWFEKRQVQKIYKAITESASSQEIASEPFEWKAKVLRGKKRSYIHEKGKSSLTRARVIRRLENGLIWELEPVTGRPHQLRFDLSRNGFPIWGDQLYGSQTQLKPDQIALRSESIRFLSPDKDNWQLPELIEIKDPAFSEKLYY